MIFGVRFDVLGALRVHNGDQELPVSGTLRRNLLAVLLTRANRPVPAEVLVAALWGDESDGDLRRLHLQVHRLRNVLDDPGRLSHEPAGYCLRVGPGELDATRFDGLVDEAGELGASDPGRAAELLRAALDLWRGRPYEGVDVPELAGRSTGSRNAGWRRSRRSTRRSSAVDGTPRSSGSWPISSAGTHCGNGCTRCG